MRTYQQRELWTLALVGLVPLAVSLIVAWALLEGAGLVHTFEAHGKQLKQALETSERVWQEQSIQLEKQVAQLCLKHQKQPKELKEALAGLHRRAGWLRGVEWAGVSYLSSPSSVPSGFSEVTHKREVGGRSMILQFWRAIPLVEIGQWKHLLGQMNTHLEAKRAGRVGFLWAALSMLAATLLLALLLGVTLTRFLLRELRELRQLIWKFAPSEPILEERRRPPRDELEGLQQDIAWMLRHIQQQQQNEVFKEQVARWQDIARRLAHEIKNPLTPILLSIQQLVRIYKGTDQAFLRSLHTSEEIIQEEVQTLRRLVDEFSSFAKLPPVEPSLIDLNALLREYLEAYDWFRGKAKVHFDAPEGALWVMADRMLFRSVLHNLVQNAMEAGSPVVILRAGRVPPRQVICQVEDQGPGIPVHLQSKIFTPYFTTKQLGTGLGLAIAKKIIIDHGGSITVGSNTLGGATFSILLPEAVSSAAFARTPSREPTTTTEKTNLDGAKR
ncbi:MAG: hypothetical protein H6727_05215 [Myxococcales bacterium]|nr:hypothetical protein [Myxococcales bacterium]